MDASIGPTGYGSGDLCLQQDGKSVFEDSLDRALTGLTGVPVKARPVVRDFETVNRQRQLKTPLSNAKGAPISNLMTAVTAKAISTETPANL